MRKLSFLLFLLSYTSFSQTITQTVRGKITDAEAKYPLIGVTVIITDTTKLVGTITDEKGDFRLTNIPVGRHNFKISYIGYKDAILNNIVVTSGKEVILNIELQESVMALNAIEIKATRHGEVQNEMATVSARSFTIEETDRYAGSRGDPARMASNFAGVQGADDSRNDIVIRGNSPQAVLWQLEGINIPNPNHFAIPGTAGGPVSIINNHMLANSDFYTGAFPAEFGNSIAGVFDLKMRNGNNEKYEFSSQIGFLGTELFGEGPISKSKKSSFLFTYRYSTLSLFSFMGIKIGTDAVPKYQDASFRLNFPTKKGGNLSFFGIGGASNVDIIVSQNSDPSGVYGDTDRDQYFGSKMGIVGASYTQPINKNTFIKATVAASAENVNAHHDYIFWDNSNQVLKPRSIERMLGYNFTQSKYSSVFYLYKKINAKNTINIGFNNDLFKFNFLDSVRTVNNDMQILNPWEKRWDANEYAILIQPYIQWKHRFSDKLVLNSGIHSQYFSLSNSLSAIEPRVGLNWNLPNGQSLNFGYGMHSQIQPTYTYFYSRDKNFGKLANKKMGFSRSNHYVIGYDKMLGNTMRLKAETYYQYLYNIPVEVRENSSFSMVNTGAGFSRIFPEQLINAGVAQNYGIELTLEKFFSNKYFFLLTASLFESKYQGRDKVWRDTDFNGNYAVNGLITKEFTVSKHSSFSIGTKTTLAGGRRYGPVDLEESNRQQDLIFIDASRNSLQFRDYFRQDFRINYRVNRPKVSHEIAIDLVNAFNTKNQLKLTLVPKFDEPGKYSIREENQLGFLPLFYYKVDF
jgi:hypothetical protein